MGSVVIQVVDQWSQVERQVTDSASETVLITGGTFGSTVTRQLLASGVGRSQDPFCAMKPSGRFA